MNVFFSKLEKLLNYDSKLSLILLNKLLLIGIPFNRPHRFKILKLNQTEALILLPFIRANKNHLATVHACSMATVGEYAAGIVLIKNFPISQNRLIMKKLEIEFFKQAKTSLYGASKVSQKELKRIQKELVNTKRSEVLVTTDIINDKKEKIAVVKTLWQLKNWKEVKFK